MIEGTIVNLRAREMGDLERNYRWINDREVTRFLGSGRYQMALAAEESWLRAQCERPITFAQVALAIETKDGRHIGNIGLFDVSPEDRRAELGIMIGEIDCWSRGFGTDAIRTLVRFAFDEMNLHRVTLRAYAFNERGLACYRKCGFIEEARERQAVFADGRYHDMVAMGILRDEFAALAADASRSISEVTT